MVLGLDFKLMYNIKMNYIKKNIFSFILIIFVFSFPILSLAQNGNGLPGSTPGSGNGLPGGSPVSDSGKIINPINADTIEGLIKVILEGVLKIGIPIIALAIIYSGFLFVAARGNSEKIGEAKSALMYTLIGAAILLGAWGIALLISNTVLSL